MQHSRLLLDSLVFRVENRNIKKGVTSPETGANRQSLTFRIPSTHTHILLKNPELRVFHPQ